MQTDLQIFNKHILDLYNPVQHIRVKVLTWKDHTGDFASFNTLITNTMFMFVGKVLQSFNLAWKKK